jgi:hypothetical protein
LINRPGAHAPGCSARPPSGPISSNHARCVVFETISARRTHAAVAETSDLLPPITDGTPALLSLAKQGQTGSSGQSSNSKQPVRPALARHFERPPATAVRISSGINLPPHPAFRVNPFPAETSSTLNTYLPELASK